MIKSKSKCNKLNRTLFRYLIISTNNSDKMAHGVRLKDRNSRNFFENCRRPIFSTFGVFRKRPHIQWDSRESRQTLRRPIWRSDEQVVAFSGFQCRRRIHRPVIGVDLEFSICPASLDAVHQVPVVTLVKIKRHHPENEFSRQKFTLERFPGPVFEGRVPALGQVLVWDDLFFADGVIDLVVVFALFFVVLKLIVVLNFDLEDRNL